MVSTQNCVASNESKLTAAVLSIHAVELETSLPQFNCISKMQVLQGQQCPDPSKKSYAVPLTRPERFLWLVHLLEYRVNLTNFQL